MINTTEYAKIPATAMYRITGEIDVAEVQRGTIEANKVIKTIIQKYGGFNLVVDARDVTFVDLVAHKMWKQNGDNFSGDYRKHYIALVLNDSPNARAEKDIMETEQLKFFFNLAQALAWIENMASSEMKT